jgi:hypothetical protein
VEGFIRPEATILDENTIVPDRNLISPAPNHFTHEVVQSQPFYFLDEGWDTKPAGQFGAGSSVLLVHRGRDRCWVIDARGLLVLTRCAGLKAKARVKGRR